MTMNEMGARAKTAARALANAVAQEAFALLHAAGALRPRPAEHGAVHAPDLPAVPAAGRSRAVWFHQ